MRSASRRTGADSHRCWRHEAGHQRRQARLDSVVPRRHPAVPETGPRHTPRPRDTRDTLGRAPLPRPQPVPQASAGLCSPKHTHEERTDGAAALTTGTALTATLCCRRGPESALALRGPDTEPAGRAAAAAAGDCGRPPSTVRRRRRQRRTTPHAKTNTAVSDAPAAPSRSDRDEMGHLARPSRRACAYQR